MDDAGIKLDEKRWHLSGPVGYFDFMRLMVGSKVVLSDSGGIQEETTVLGVPCRHGECRHKSVTTALFKQLNICTRP